MESDYPYTSGESGKMTYDCKYNDVETTNATVSSYSNVTPSSPTQMQAALATQPLAVAVEASSNVFRTYESGVLSSSSCGTNLDHAVLVVGNGTENGQDYWLVKNSWSSHWG